MGDHVTRPGTDVNIRAPAAKAAQAAGAKIALPPMEISGGGRFAIYIQGGIEHGLWQL